MTVFKKIADVAQKGSVLGLMSLLGYQVYQIGRNVKESTIDTKYHHTDMFKKINDKVKEEGQDRGNYNSIPDRYEADDNSYLKNVPDLQSTTTK